MLSVSYLTIFMLLFGIKSALSFKSLPSNLILRYKMQNNKGKSIMSAIGANGNSDNYVKSVFTSALGDKKRFSTSSDNNNADTEARKKNSASRIVQYVSPTDRKPAAPAVSSTSSNIEAILKANGISDATEVPIPENTKKPNNRPKKSKPAPQPAATPVQAVSSNVVETQVEEANEEKASYLTDKSFNDLNIHPNTKRAINEVMKFRFMTQVQHESLPEILKGHDALVKAKTGTGKTVGFLVPAIEILLNERRKTDYSIEAPPQPRILILSPTRELAQQIANEAESLCKFHRMGITLLVGGTNLNADVRQLKRNGEGENDIIVATPGRLVQHLQETKGVPEMIQAAKVFCLDEADRLLDMGFKKDIDIITRHLNQRNPSFGKRQTLLFSATVSREIQDVARSTLLPGYKFIDTVGDEVEQTHAHVPQQLMVVPLDQQVRAMVAIIEEQKRIDPDYKMILFFPTARQTGFYAGMLNNIGMKCLEIHSRKSQAHRTRVSEEFRIGRNVILLSSDVSARGMDYPDVSFVLQVGMTMRDQYIHRLGRTARAGKEGSGLLMLAPFEYNAMVKELNDLPLQEVPPPAILNGAGTPLMQRAAQAIAVDSSDGNDDDSEDGGDNAARAWSAWLGYYNGQLKKINMDKAQLVQLSNFYANSIGLPEIPPLPKKTIGMMGMKGVPGLKIAEDRPHSSRGGPPRNNSQRF